MGGFLCLQVLPIAEPKAKRYFADGSILTKEKPALYVKEKNPYCPWNCILLKFLQPLRYYLRSRQPP